MEIKKITVAEFIPGQRYSLMRLGNSYNGYKGVLDAVFVSYMEHPDRGKTIPYNVLTFKTRSRGEIKVELAGTATTQYEVILHRRQNFYILVGHDYIVGTFESQSDAQEYLEDWGALFLKLINTATNSDPIVQICDAETLETIASDVMQASGQSSSFHPIRIDYRNDSLVKYIPKLQ